MSAHLFDVHYLYSSSGATSENTELPAGALELNGQTGQGDTSSVSGSTPSDQPSGIDPFVDGAGDGGAYIGATNYLVGAALSATTEATDFDVENVAERTIYDKWKATAGGTQYVTAVIADAQSKDVECWGVVGHNLYSLGGSIQLQYSTNAGGSWNNYGSAVTPTSSAPIFVVGSLQTAQHWRFEIVSGGVPIISVLHIGPVLQLPRGMNIGFSPAKFSREAGVTNNISEGGKLIGRSTRRAASKSSFALPNVLPAYVRTAWRPFIEFAESRPFFFAWDYSNYSTEISYCAKRGRAVVPYGHESYQTVSIEFDALTD